MEKNVRVWPLVWLVVVFMMCALLPKSVAYATDKEGKRPHHGFEATHADDADEAWSHHGSAKKDSDDAEEARIKRGFEIAPVPLKLEGKNRNLVGLGSYIVNAQGTCNNCHTHPSYAPGGNPFKGEPEQINVEQYMAGGRQFLNVTPCCPLGTPQTLTADNITPDEHGRPVGLTFKEFRQTLRTGHNPQDTDEPGEVLQQMSWPIFGKMTDRDLRAVYEYLRAIPSLPDNHTCVGPDNTCVPVP